MEGHIQHPEMPGMENERGTEREAAPDLAADIDQRANLVGEAADALRADMGKADDMLAEIKDPTRRDQFAATLERLRARTEGFGDPRAIADKMVEELGAEAFQKKETPPEELN